MDFGTSSAGLEETAGLGAAVLAIAAGVAAFAGVAFGAGGGR